MRLTSKLRHILDVYFVVLATLAGLTAVGLLAGGLPTSLLGGVVLSAVMIIMLLWLVAAYFAGASPGTYMRPSATFNRGDVLKFALATGNPDLVLPQASPPVMKDLHEKLVGNQSDIMMFAAGNAALCFGIGIILVYVPAAALVGLLATLVAVGATLAFSR